MFIGQGMWIDMGYICDCMVINGLGIMLYDKNVIVICVNEQVLCDVSVICVQGVCVFCIGCGWCFQFVVVVVDRVSVFYLVGC